MGKHINKVLTEGNDLCGCGAKRLGSSVFCQKCLVKIKEGNKRIMDLKVCKVRIKNATTK